MCDRGSFYPESGIHDISVLSWNVLAPEYDRSGLDWKRVRLPELRQWLLRFIACDIMCFQEVDLTNALADISETLAQHGFHAVVQERKGFPVVNAIFYRAGRFRLVSTQHRSRALIIGLALADGREVTVANVHLEAGAREPNEKQRIAQLSSLLKRVRGNAIVCGDFNSGLEYGSMLSSQLIAAGLVRAPTIGITLAQKNGYSDILDHIWASDAFKAHLVLGSSPEELSAIEATGMPDSTHPSDHLPVAATFFLARDSMADRRALGRNCVLPALDIPSTPGQDMCQEWLQICWCAPVNATKREAREQKRLEAAFLDMLGGDDAANLRNWRNAAAEAAKDVIANAVNTALSSLSVVQLAPSTMPDLFDPGGSSGSVNASKEFQFVRPSFSSRCLGA